MFAFLKGKKNGSNWICENQAWVVIPSPLKACVVEEVGREPWILPLLTKLIPQAARWLTGKAPWLATSGEQMGKQSRGKQGTFVKEMLKSQLSKYCRLYPGEKKKNLQWKIDQVQNILNIINTGGLGQGQWAYLACPRYCVCSHSRQIYFLT